MLCYSRAHSHTPEKRQMADHKHHVKGSMDISEQTKSYAMFWTATKWTIYLCTAIVVFLAIFRTN